MHFRNMLLATALGHAALAQAVAWPQWRGPTRDGILPANGIMLTKLPDQPKVVWKIKSGEHPRRGDGGGVQWPDGLVARRLVTF